MRGHCRGRSGHRRGHVSSRKGPYSYEREQVEHREVRRRGKEGSASRPATGAGRTAGRPRAARRAPRRRSGCRPARGGASGRGRGWRPRPAPRGGRRTTAGSRAAARSRILVDDRPERQLRVGQRLHAHRVRDVVAAWQPERTAAAEVQRAGAGRRPAGRRKAARRCSGRSSWRSSRSAAGGREPKKKRSQSISRPPATGESRRDAACVLRVSTPGRSGRPAAVSASRRSSRANHAVAEAIRGGGELHRDGRLVLPRRSGVRRSSRAVRARAQDRAQDLQVDDPPRKSCDDDPLVMPAHDPLSSSKSSSPASGGSSREQPVDDFVVKLDEQQVQLGDDEVLVVAGVADARPGLARCAAGRRPPNAVVGVATDRSFTPGSAAGQS